MHLLIDADSAIFKAGMSNETRHYIVYDESGHTVGEFAYKKEADAFIAEQDEPESYVLGKSRVVGPKHFSLANLKSLCASMMGTPHDTFQMYIGGKGNFREEVWPDYKIDRRNDKSGRPLHEKELRNYLIKYWDATVVDGEEVDDRVSWMQCLDDTETCIVTVDKDLLNTAGWNYNYNKKILQYITPEQADLNFARQLLTGDSTDGIPGLKGVAAKTAAKILPEYREDWLEVVLKEYEKRVPEWNKEEREAYITRNGIMLWMRRKPNEIWSLDYEY